MELNTRRLPRDTVNLGSSLNVFCDNEPSAYATGCSLSSSYSAQVGTITTECTESTDDSIYEGADLIDVENGQIFFSVVSGSSVENGLICGTRTIFRITRTCIQSTFRNAQRMKRVNVSDVTVAKFVQVRSLYLFRSFNLHIQLFIVRTASAVKCFCELNTLLL